MGVLKETVVHGPKGVIAVVKGTEHAAVAAGLEAYAKGLNPEPVLAGRVIYFRGGEIVERIGETTKLIAEIVGEAVASPSKISNFLKILCPPQEHELARVKQSISQGRGARRKPPAPRK